MGRAMNAFVSIRSLMNMEVRSLEGAFIRDGGAIGTLTRILENCTLCNPKVVEIQTEHGSTSMSTITPLLQSLSCLLSTRRNPTNYCQRICGSRTEIWFIISQRTNLCWLCWLCCTPPCKTKENLEYVLWFIINRTYKSKYFPFKGEHSNILSEIRTNVCETACQTIRIWTVAPKACSCVESNYSGHDWMHNRFWILEKDDFQDTC